MPTWVRFERGRDGVVGPTFGPFPFVQLTYRLIRFGPDGSELAFMGADDDWQLVRFRPEPAMQGDEGAEYFSDAIVYDGEKPE